MIRCTSKAIIRRDGKILLNRCAIDGRIYYDLPGGGQEEHGLIGPGCIGTAPCRDP